MEIPLFTHGIVQLTRHIPAPDGCSFVGLIWLFALVYIDNIVVYAHSYTELCDHLAIVFQRLHNANLKLKPGKVHLFQREIKFLGHCVSGHGISMDESKTMKILQWPIPRNVHEIRMFLGLCGYYRRYVQDFARMPYHCMS